MPKYKCDKCGTEYKTPFCPNCGDKRTKKDEEMMTDVEIIADVLGDASEVVTKKVKHISKVTIIGLFLILMSVLLFFVAMYHKNAYYNSDSNKENVNAYVEDDGFNYLINSNYFNGYMSLSGIFLLSGVLVFLSEQKSKKK